MIKNNWKWLAILILVVSFAAITILAYHGYGTAKQSYESSGSISNVSYSILASVRLDSGKTVSVFTGNRSIFFKSRMLIDADGSPRAYHPRPDDNLGLDDLSYAGEPGNWWALAVDENGKPYIQGAGDPAPGYYVSTTSLSDSSNPNDADPRKYVNSEEIPYFVLPQNVYNISNASLGDFGVVYNKNSGKIAYAILADIDNGIMDRNIGECSIALANQLGIDSNPRTGGIEDMSIVYIIFPGSGAGDGKLRTAQEIDENGQRLFMKWGGMKKLESLS